MEKSDTRSPDSFWDAPLDELLSQLEATPAGLTEPQAQDRLKSVGPNELAPSKRFGPVREFLGFFANPLVLILLVASGVSYATGGHVEALIIVSIVFLSVILNFYQVFQAQKAVQDLRKQVALTASVVRDGATRDVPVTELVPGDVIKLTAGSLVPADARLLEENDLHVRESALTGESLPIEKDAADLAGDTHAVADALNSVFMGTSVQSGIATAVVVRTGPATEFGRIAGNLATREPETEFDRGIKNFGFLLIRVIMLLVLFVFVVNIAAHRPLLDALLFALALAVGLTPELLPVVLTVTLAQGAKRMARKKVIVKQLAAIENFGSIEILCSDKTGTLTLGEVTLQRSVDVRCNDDDRVLEWVYLNSFFEAGMNGPLDDAILAHPHPNIDEFTKLDEIPFDFDRRRLSVVVKRGDERTLITKGAAEDLFDVCTSVEVAGDGVVPFDAEQRKLAEQSYQQLSLDGYRVLGVATRIMDARDDYKREDERDLTLVGFAAFLDPPKEGVADTLRALADDGVRVLVMTGDNEHVTRKVAVEVGLPADDIIVGSQVDAMDDAALAVQAEKGAMFARVSPEQKNRVITALKRRGWVVGFLGDGINDAPSMHAADVGISVVNGVEVARDAANIILLEKDLAVLDDGIREGRSSFANIMKYIVMGTSSNFGNMFSMAGASLFLPFLPMLPTQILLNNLLYDMSQMAIPSDNVDSELMRRPKRWKINFIRQFMVIIGPISSIYDFLTFGALLFVFHANQQLFHTGWFVESLATQTLVVFVIRTAGNPLKSRPSRGLIAAVLAVVAVAFVLPYTPLGTLIGFIPMPPLLVGTILFFAATYLGLVQVVKRRFYKHHELI
jgi:Mg2+-importing ATPase